MNNRKHIESSGPFAGLWIRTARALRKAGYKSREEIRDDIRSGALSPRDSILDYGRFADAEVRAWLRLNVTDALGLWRGAAKDGTLASREDKRDENSPGKGRVSKKEGVMNPTNKHTEAANFLLNYAIPSEEKIDAMSE